MPASNNPQLSALLIADVEKAFALIISALKKTHGDVRAAAKKLEVDRRTLTRWIERHPRLARERSAAKRHE